MKIGHGYRYPCAGHTRSGGCGDAQSGRKSSTAEEHAWRPEHATINTGSRVECGSECEGRARGGRCEYRALFDAVLQFFFAVSCCSQLRTSLSTLSPTLRVDLPNTGVETRLKCGICNCTWVRYRLGSHPRFLLTDSERNHNIRIPGFSSDETRMSLSQPTIAPVVAPATAKKAQQVSHMTLRSHRLAQVQQAKREGKLV
jgi:hypothetical protein